MLPYENQMFLDVLSSDGLVVAAKGLGLEHVFASLLRVYSDPGNLVLVMGTAEEEEEHFVRQVVGEDTSTSSDNGGDNGDAVRCVAAKRITSDYSTSERQRVYLQGGVLFVTTRILGT